MSTFIIQASNSTRIHTLFTIEAKVGDFLCHLEKGEYKEEFTSLNQLKKDLI